MLTAKVTKMSGPAPDHDPHVITQLPSTRVAALVAEHDDLDRAVAVLLDSSICDDLLITRLKKRKLQIKDEIALAVCSVSAQMPGDYIASRATA